MSERFIGNSVWGQQFRYPCAENSSNRELAIGHVAQSVALEDTGGASSCTLRFRPEWGPVLHSRVCIYVCASIPLIQICVGLCNES